MFERQLYRRSLFCAIWLCVATAAVAQSNQPIEIISATALPLDTRPAVSSLSKAHPSSSKETAVAERPVAWDQTLKTVGHGPETTTEPVRPRSTGSHPLGRTTGPETDQAVVSPVERWPLGRSSGQPSSTQADTGADTVVGSGGWLWNTLIALGVVIICIGLLRVVLSRWSGQTVMSANNPVLEVLARVSVAPRKHVLLIRLGKRIVVVGDCGSELRTLANIDNTEEVAGLLTDVAATRARVSGGFTQLLRRMNSDYRHEQRRIDEGGDTSECDVDRARDQVSNLLARVRHLNLPRRGGAA